MDQKLAELNSEEMSLLLKDSLVEQELISKENLDNLLAEKEEKVKEAKKQIKATCYAVDYIKNQFIIFDTFTNETLFSTDLPNKPKKHSLEEFDDWGTSAAILDLVEMQKEGEIPFNKNFVYGIAFNDEKTYLYNSDLDKQNILAITDKYIFGANPKSKGTGLPYDLFLSKNKQLICLANRDEGKVYVFDIKDKQFKHEIAIRNAGSLKGLNVAINDNKKTIHITDNQTPFIYKYDLVEKKLDKKSLSNLGILGNICLSPDGKTLFTITLKPDQSFKALNAETYEVIKDFPIKGDFFSLGNDPTDLLTIAPDNIHLFYMTYINDPNPFTPVITVIDVEKNKALKRFSIKDETKPINLAFKDENPIGSVNLTLEELLVEKGYFTFNKLRDLKLALMNGNEEEVAKLKKQMVSKEEEKKDDSKVEEKIEGVVEVEGEIIDLPPIGVEEPKIIVGKPTPKKTKHVIIPVKANKQIKEILIGSFWQKTEIDLTEIPEEEDRLNTLSDNIRKKLEYYDLEIVDIKNYFERFPMDTIIQRDYIVEMLHEEESSKRQKVTAGPSNCMNCSAPMYGAWECPVCGFIYEKPEDAIKRKVASLEPLANLQKGYFFVHDKEKGILVELDNYKIPVWAVHKDDMELTSLTKAYRLDNKNTMILDKESNTIFEISPKGRDVWKYTTEEEESKLSSPSNFGILEDSELLIADTDNHRMVEMTLDGHIIWQYGRTKFSGKSFNELNSPSDAQKTYDGTYLIADSGNNRLIEIIRELNIETGHHEVKVLWEFSDGLNNPTQVYKEIDGKILVLDSGNNRLVQIDPQYGIIWEFSGSNLPENYRIDNIQSFLRLKNKDLILVGNGKVIEVLPENTGGKVIWNESIDSIEERTTYRVTKEDIKKSKAKYGAKAYQGKFGKAKHEEVKDKKQDKKKVNASHYMKKAGEKTHEEEIIEEKNEELERIIEERRKALDGKFEGEKPHILLSPNKQVLPFPVMLIDKNENKILLSNRDGDILWTYGELKEHHMVKPQIAELTQDKTVLITDVDKVEEIRMKTREVLWKYNCRPRYAVKLKNGHYLICDEKNSRVIEVDKNKEIVWEHKEERPPVHALRLSNGNTLITIAMAHIVKEITPNGETVWQFGQNKKVGSDSKHLSYPEHASRLSNGNTLITDTKNARILEVSHDGEIVWNYKGNSSLMLISPTYSIRFKDGNTYIIHSNYKHILEVDHKGGQIWRLIMPSKVEHKE
ncbi:MAG: hypothetical protein U0457_00935 [Candidatus Sericytochromatia bacterium]